MGPLASQGLGSQFITRTAVRRAESITTYFSASGSQGGQAGGSAARVTIPLKLLGVTRVSSLTD